MIITENKAVTDTFVVNLIDTITFERNSVRIDIKRFYDTIMVDVECPSDTIRIQKEVKVPQVIYQEKKFNRNYLLLFTLSIILYTLALLKLTK